MKTLKINNTWFRGQYAAAIENLQKGNTIDIRDFSNGSWEATTPLSHFLGLLNIANIKYNRTGNSLRQTQISLNF